MAIKSFTAPSGATFDYDPDTTNASYAYSMARQQYPEDFVPPPKQSGLRRIADYGLSALDSAISLPEMFVGLADIPTGGAVGRGLEELGYRPKAAHEAIAAAYSDAQKAADQRVAAAYNQDGIMAGLGTALVNPSTIAHTIVKSAAPMIGGGVMGRGIKALGAADYAAAGAGEGLSQAGSMAEGIREDSATGSITAAQSGAALASGIVDALISGGGARLAKHLGISDIQTAIVNGKLNPVAGAEAAIPRLTAQAAEKSPRGFLSSVLLNGFSEGVLQELPQSAQEQMWQNYATDRPLMEGVAQAAGTGLLSGAVMGSGVQAMTPDSTPAPTTAPVAAPKVSPTANPNIPPMAEESPTVKVQTQDAQTPDFQKRVSDLFDRHVDITQADFTAKGLEAMRREYAAHFPMDTPAQAKEGRKTLKEMVAQAKVAEQVAAEQRTADAAKAQESALTTAPMNAEGVIPGTSRDVLQPADLNALGIHIGHAGLKDLHKALVGLDVSNPEDAAQIIKHIDFAQEQVNDNKNKAAFVENGETHKFGEPIRTAVINPKVDSLRAHAVDTIRAVAEQQPGAQTNIFGGVDMPTEQQVEEPNTVWEVPEGQKSLFRKDGKTPTAGAASQAYNTEVADAKKAKGSAFITAQPDLLGDILPEQVAQELEEPNTVWEVPEGQAALPFDAVKPESQQPQEQETPAVQWGEPAAEVIPEEPYVDPEREARREEAKAAAHEERLRREEAKSKSAPLTDAEKKVFTDNLANEAYHPHDDYIMRNASDDADTGWQADQQSLQGVDNLHAALTLFSKDVRLTRKQKKVIEKLLQHPAVKRAGLMLTNFDAKWVNAEGVELPEYATYNLKNNGVTLHNGAGLRSLIHEGVHAALLAELESNEAFKARMESLFKESKRKVDPKYHKLHGFYDVHEFLSEYFANPSFRALVHRAPHGASLAQRIIHAIKEVIRRMLGPDMAKEAMDMLHIESEGAATFRADYERGAVTIGEDGSIRSRAGAQVTDDPDTVLELKERSTYEAKAYSDPKSMANMFKRLLNLDTLANKIVGPATVFEARADKALGSSEYDQTGNLRGDLVYAANESISTAIQNALTLGGLTIDPSGVALLTKSDNNILNVSMLHKQVMDRATAKYGEKEAYIGMQNALAMGRYKYERAMNAARELKIAELTAENKYKNRKEIKKLEASLKSTDEFTDADMQSGEAFMAEFPEVRQVLDMLRETRKVALQAKKDSGLINQKKLDSLLDNKDWVPFQRIGFEDSDGGGLLYGKGQRAYAKEHAYKGSTREISDVMTNYADFIQRTYDKSIRNATAMSMARTMESMGEGAWGAKDKVTNRSVPIAIDGEVKYFTPYDAAMAAPFMSYPTVNSFYTNIAAKVSNLLRKGVTFTPQFWAKQVGMEDAVRVTMATAGMPNGFISNYLQNWKNFAQTLTGKPSEHGNSQAAEELLRGSVIGNFDTMESPRHLLTHLTKDKNMLEKTTGALEHVLRASDLASRITVVQGMKKTHDAELAKMKAGGASQEQLDAKAHEQFLSRVIAAGKVMRYSNRGTSSWLRNAMQMVPFINPRIQGMHMLWKAMNGRIPGMDPAEAKRMFAIRAASWMTMVALYSMMMSGDDDYENQGESTRAGNFLIPIGDGEFFKFAVPPEFTPFKIAAESFARTMSDNPNQTEAAFARQMSAAIANNMFHYGADFIPTILKPIADIATNKQLSTLSINPFAGGNEPMVSMRDLISSGMENLDTSLQHNSSTSEFAKMLGQQTGFSPIRVDAFLKGYLGSMAGIALDITNRAAHASSGEGAPVDKAFLFGSFFSSPYDVGNKDVFYPLRDRVTSAGSSAKALAESGDSEAYLSFVADHQNELALIKYVSQVETALGKIRKAKQQVNASEGGDEEKRAQLKELAETERMLLRDVNRIQAQGIQGAD